MVSFVLSSLFVEFLWQAKWLGALNKFKAGECNILICTDVASRGLDIPSVDMVINYDIPSNSKVRFSLIMACSFIISQSTAWQSWVFFCCIFACYEHSAPANGFLQFSDCHRNWHRSSRCESWGYAQCWSLVLNYVIFYILLNHKS